MGRFPVRREVDGGVRIDVGIGALVVDRCPEGLAQVWGDVVLDAERTIRYGAFADGRPWGEQEAWFLTVCDVVREIPPFEERGPARG